MTHPDSETDFNWTIRAESAAVLVPEKFKGEEKGKRLWRIVPHQNENDLQAQKDAADRGEREGEEE